MLFDFGLAKLVRIETGITAHKLTGVTGALATPPKANPLPSPILPCHWSPVSGARRYMAPEARPLGLTRGKGGARNAPRQALTQTYARAEPLTQTH